jgi:cell division protease FtsH
VDALLDPETVERLAALRKYVEQPDGAFPPPPLAKDVPLPIYGISHMGLEAWKQRRINVITWSAMEMLYTDRQKKMYREDMDMPR